MTTVPLNDLNGISMKRNGLVESVTINGNYSFRENDIFPKDSNALIVFHSRALQ